MNTNIGSKISLHQPEKHGKKRLAFLYGAPMINPQAKQAAWEEYQQKALPIMRDWIKTVQPKVQYADVMEQLKHCVKDCPLPFAHEGIFCRKVILPNLESLKEVDKIDNRMLAILYSIGFSCDWKELLEGLKAKEDRTLMTFSIKCSISGYVGIVDYEIFDYLNPSVAKVKTLGVKIGSGLPEASLSANALKC